MPAAAAAAAAAAEEPMVYGLAQLNSGVCTPRSKIFQRKRGLF